MQITPNVRPFVPGVPANASELTDTSPEVVDNTPIESKHKAMMDDLLGPNLSEKGRTRCQQILRVYPTNVLKHLKDFGLKFEITQGQGPAIGPGGQVALGGYDPIKKTIMFDEGVLLAKIGRHMLTHELVHAIDAMHGERAYGKTKDPILASGKDPELAKIYAAFQARGAVEAIGQLRYDIKSENNGALPPQAHVRGEDNWGAMEVDYKHENGKEVFRIDQQPKLPKGLMEQIAEAAGMAGPDRVARELPRTEVDVKMKKGLTAHVVHEGTVSEVTVPEGAISYTGDIWSDYAHRSGMAEEYLAEGVSHWLENGNVKDEMEGADPDMVSYVQKFIDDEFNLAG